MTRRASGGSMGRRTRWILVVGLAAIAASADRQVVLEERFDAGLPAGWTVVDNAGSGAPWRFDDPGLRGNLTGGSGGFASADSDFAQLVAVDTELRTPVLDLTGVTGVQLHFDTELNVYQGVGGGSEIADVDLSLDGGGLWSNIWRRVEADGDFEGFVQIPLPAADGQASVRLRFHYFEAYYDYWWQVDDVLVAGIDPDEIFADGFESGTASHWSGTVG